MYHDMDDLIEVCVNNMASDAFPPEQARAYMRDLLPKLDYWKNHTNLEGAEAFEAFKLIDIAFSGLYGTVPLTEEVIKKAIDDYIPLVNLDYICSVKNEENKIVGFAVLVPSIAKALKKSNGKLLPFGMFRMLKALKGKNGVLEMFFVAVDPEYQRQGIPMLLMNEMIKMCMKNKVEYCESGPELETNSDVQGMWKKFETRQHKRRRCYVKEI